MDFQNNLVRNVEKKKFDFDLVDRLELNCHERNGKRFYTCPLPGGRLGIDYLSVTTILDEKSDKSWYNEWVAKIGQDEADKITTMATRRGQSIHNMAEKYIRGEDYWKDHGTINVMNFNKPCSYSQ